MFRHFELEKLLYTHPAFLGLWHYSPFKLARHLLQGQLVNHVLKDVGLVVIVTQVVSITGEIFDPNEGGIYARVRFTCFVYVPAPRSILRGRVDKIEADGVTVSCAGLPSAKIPASLLHKGTVFNDEKKYFVWTRTLENGSPKYFETKHGDEVRYQVDSIEYDKKKEIVMYDPKLEPVPMDVTGDLRTFSLGPVHWYAQPKTPETEKNTSDSLEVAAEALSRKEPDYVDFLKSLLVPSEQSAR